MVPGGTGTDVSAQLRPSKYRKPPVYGSGYQPAGADSGGGREFMRNEAATAAVT